jgi:hypothetical protein
MKYLIVLCLLLLSCEKPQPEQIIEPVFCYQCWREYINPVHNIFESLEIDFCNMTEEQMNRIIKENTYYSPDSTVSLILRCQKGGI